MRYIVIWPIASAIIYLALFFCSNYAATGTFSIKAPKWLYPNQLQKFLRYRKIAYSWIFPIASIFLGAVSAALVLLVFLII
jgi:hypothetical protein